MEKDKVKNKNGWGGKREGSGRPRTTTIQRVYSIRANDDLARYIESHEHKSEFIKGCVIKEMRGEYATAPVVADAPNVVDAAPAEAAPVVPEVVSAPQAAEPAKAEHTDSPYNDFDYSVLGEMCADADAKTFSMPYYDTKEDSSSFPKLDSNKVKSQDMDILGMLCPHPGTSALIKVKGDSMTDADIYDGDIIIVDRSNRNPTDRELAVCELNGEYTIKYVRVRDKRGILVPANRDFPEWRITPDDNFNVWGTVTFVIHKPRNL